MQYGHRLIVRCCHRLLTGFQAKDGALGELRTSILDAGQRGCGAGAVAAMCDKLDSLSRKYRTAYVLSLLSHVAQVYHTFPGDTSVPILCRVKCLEQCCAGVCVRWLASKRAPARLGVRAFVRGRQHDSALCAHAVPGPPLTIPSPPTTHNTLPCLLTRGQLGVTAAGRPDGGAGPEAHAGTSAGSGKRKHVAAVPCCGRSSPSPALASSVRR